MKKIHIISKPLSISLITLLIVSAFFRYYLFAYSVQQMREFKNQNFDEIYSLDKFKVSSRLNSLSSAINWVCIEAQLGGKTFFNTKKAQCETGIFQQQQILKLSEADNFTVKITTKLPIEIESLFVVFFILQTILIYALIGATRKMEEDKRSSELRINKIAMQMSHDIRSPLATLKEIIGDMRNMEDVKFNLLSRAMSRIEYIANHLLDESRSIEKENVKIDSTLKDNNVLTLIKEIIEEKKIEYKNDKNIEINFLYQSYLFICKIDSHEFKKIISNILNNSIEARKAQNSIIKIDLELIRINDRCILNVIDNGKGIPVNILSSLGNTKITNKTNGNGIGLLSTVEILKNWDGKLLIESIENHGTKIIISIPLVKNKRVVLIDDDELVRLTWEFSAKKHNICLRAFPSSKEFDKQIGSIGLETNIYIDSKLSDNQNGEDFAVHLKELGFKNLFITSGYDKERFLHLDFLIDIIDKAPPW